MKSFVNLLPFEYRRKELVRRRLRHWLLVWIICTVIAAGIGWAKHGRYRGCRRAMETAQCRYRPLAKLMRQRDAARRELHQLHAKEAILSQLGESKPVLTLMGVVSRSAQDCGGRLMLRNLVFERHKTQPGPGQPQRPKTPKSPQQPTAQKPSPWATVTLEGDALDNLAIATFAAGLRDTGLFRRVELKSSVGKGSANVKVHSFTVACDI